MNDKESKSPQEPSKPDGLEVVCAGILRTQFGRKRSRALGNAMIRLEAEQPAAGRSASDSGNSWAERIRGWANVVWSPRRLAAGLSLVVVIGLAGWVLWSEGIIRPSEDHPVSICKISDGLEVRWAGKSTKLKAGDTVGPELLRLESGVVELKYLSGTKVAIEGPAQFKVGGPNRLELLSGKISTEVPRGARGFSVKSPTATVVDLGTRFGEIVNAERATEVDVFQGKVEVAPRARNAARWQLTQGKALIADAQTAMAATSLPESAFPQPNVSVLARPQNCGFDVSARAVVGGMPADFGYWSGPAFSLTGFAQGVRPVEGAGMLQFLDLPNGSGGNSEVWQLIDLRPFKRLLASGLVTGKLSSMFNRIEGDTLPPGRFGLTLAAFSGSALRPERLWAERATKALVLADQELTTDNDPKTWEKLEVSPTLPPETDFVIIQIRAIAPSGVRSAGKLFPGHFADLVDFKLSTRMRASSIPTSR